MSPFKIGSVDVTMRDMLRPQGPPVMPSTTHLPAGHKKSPECRALPCPITFDRDQILVLRDGTRIRADIYRPETDERVPAIMMWGPYGKSGSGFLNLSAMPLRAGVPADQLSGYEGFEGLDPAEWVGKGYAVVNVDPRGVGDSEGDMRWWGTNEGQDGYDAIEELAKLPWSNGKIAMAGNSWLAMSQYFIAAQQPPHLIAIAPLEGASDPFREQFFRGGIPTTSFTKFVAGVLQGRQQQEDICAMIESSTTTNDYLDDKRADMSKIRVPAYIGASYSSDLHGVGSLRAYEEIPHENKWLVLHSTQEWYDLYTDNRTADLQKFFDYYLKDIKNGWENTSPVRLALLNFTKAPIVDKTFADLPWHLPSATSNRLYLTPKLKLSTDNAATSSGTLEYQADTDDAITLTYQIPSRTAYVGPSTLVIEVSSPNHDDLDVHAHVFKADMNGNILSNKNIPTPSNLPDDQEKLLTNNRLFRYWGPDGMLRASQRHVSPDKSGKTWKTLSHECVQKVERGSVVRLEIPLWPAGIVFEAGEMLVLKISGAKIGVPALAHLPKEPNYNHGKHVLHLRNSESYLEFFSIDV